MVEAEAKKLVRIDEASIASGGADPKLSECIKELSYGVEVWPDVETQQV